MKLHARLKVASLAGAMILSGTLHARTPGDAVEKLSWLSGCWAAEGGESGSGELWLSPAGGTLFGLSRTVKRGKTTGFEFMSIRTDATGKLVFIAQPNGAPPTSFPLKQLTDHEVIFENQSHDFPQRVIYARRGHTRLDARIEGMESGKALRIDFPLRRTACP